MALTARSLRLAALAWALAASTACADIDARRAPYGVADRDGGPGAVEPPRLATGGGSGPGAGADGRAAAATPAEDRDAAPSSPADTAPSSPADTAPSSSAAGPVDQAPAPQPDAGVRDGATRDVARDGATDPFAAPLPGADGPRVPVVVAVGYGGLRLVSRDNGKTWGSRNVLAAGGGDDQNLFRAVAYGDGMFVTVGWRLFVSPNGVDWTERKITGLYDCATYKDGNFYVKWNRGGNTALVSRDRGETWQKVDAASFTCTNSGANLVNGGVRLRSEWQGIITRSENGGASTRVYTDPQKNHPEAFVAGMGAP